MSDPTLSLREWIAKATAGLPPSAVARITAEIEDHVVESQQKLLAEGRSLDEAERSALTSLGDAEKIARTFRESHFSRHEYTRGGTAVLVLLIVGVAGILFGALSDAGDPASGFNMLRQWVWIWGGVGALSNGVLLIFATRAMLTLLREQYDMRIPLWGWRLFVICLLGAIPYGLLFRTLAWAYDFNPFFYYSVLMNWVFGILPVLQGVYVSAYLVIGALALSFLIRWLRSVSFRTQPVLGILVILSGVIGVALEMVGGVIFAAAFVPPPYPQNVPLILLMTSIDSLFPFMYIALLVILLGLFGYMRRPGAVIMS